MENNIKGIKPTAAYFEEIESLQGKPVFNCDEYSLKAIQGTYSLKPDMLRNTREAADVPEETKVQFKEVFEKEIHERREHLLETVGFLNKEGLE